MLRAGWWILFVLVALIVVAIRIRLLGIPLERDEGEYAYAGQLMLQGIPPYQLAYNMKFPGIYTAYALLMSIFGQTTIGVHLGLLLINAATVVLIFFLGRRLFNEIAGIAAATSYAVLSVSPTVLGFAGHATHFVVLPVVAGTLVLLSALDRNSSPHFLLGGFLFGMALIMKQPGAVFVLFGLLCLVFYQWKTRRGVRESFSAIMSFLGGAALPIGLTCFWLWRAGVFGNFWFWSIQYAREYGSRVSLGQGAEIFAANIGWIIGSSGAIWAIAGVGLLMCLWKIRTGFCFVLPVGLLVFSAIALSAGFYFRSHYFILALPAIALLVGVAMGLAAEARRSLRWLWLVLFFGAIGLPLFLERDFFFSLPLETDSRLTSGLNPFPESARIAKFLREHTDPSDTIAVLGSEPQIYFYAHRHSATGYIYTYALMEPHPYAARMQSEMIREIEAARPKYVVFVSIDSSWLSGPDSTLAMADWFAGYSARELTPVGLVNIISGDRTDYYLPYAGESVPSSPYRVTIYKRKT